jgi:hypothetical protein
VLPFIVVPELIRFLTSCRPRATATLIFKTARLLHAGPAVWGCRAQRSRSSSGMIALRTAVRFTEIARSSAQIPGRGSAVPLGQRSSVGPLRRSSRYRGNPVRREDPEKFAEVARVAAGHRVARASASRETTPGIRARRLRISDTSTCGSLASLSSGRRLELAALASKRNFSDCQTRRCDECAPLPQTSVTAATFFCHSNDQE